MGVDELCYLSALELRKLYQKREISPVEVTEAILRRIEQTEPVLNAFITTTPDLALQQARVAEKAYLAGDPTPMLAGVPVSYKDLTPTRGIRTTMGSPLLRDWVPDFDPPIVHRLNQAGVVTLGKTNTSERGWKADSGNPLVGPTHNPWRHGLTAGGSSGGSAAAVAAGIGPLSQGSDGVGSIRIPAAFCGVFGFKPSRGVVPQFPVSPIGLLAYIGPISRTVRDAALMLNVIAGVDPLDPLSMPNETDFLAAVQGDVEGLRVAWSPDLGFAKADPDVLAITSAAAERFSELGCHVEDADPGIKDPYDLIEIMWTAAAAGMHRGIGEEDRQRIDPGLWAAIEKGVRVTGAELAMALCKRGEYVQAMVRFMEGYDLLLTPTTPVMPFRAGADHPKSIAGQTTDYLGWTAHTYLFNLTGQPAATLPCGFSRDGLPVGLQIAGRWREDDLVLRACAAYETIAPWADCRPDISISD